MTALVREVTQAAAAAENDQKLLARLVDIRSARADDPDGSATDGDYADAFSEAGIDIAALTVEAAARLGRLPSARVSLAAALDHWAAIRWVVIRDRAGALRLTEAARLGRS